ncbi:MAG TPA: hypothetical protein P5266_06315 [Candidatus Fermentibacter sp.]|nr:hypothetical protein [Candidatus Fermentibacter sp.]
MPGNDRILDMGVEPTAFVVLTLCSYGERGDYQVLPRQAVSLDLHAILDRLKAAGRRAALDADTRLLAEMGDCRLMLYAEGRAVMESVVPDTSDAAWEIYSCLLAPCADP